MIAKLSRPVWDSFYTFAVVRDPFDQAVSHYQYLKQNSTPSIARKFQQLSFSEYLADRQKRPFLKYTAFVRMRDQAHYPLDAEGRIAVNQILRFENLNTDWNSLIEKLGIPETKLLYANKTKAKSDKKHYSEFYSAETEETVRRLSRRDFDLFGYSDRLPTTAEV